MSQQQTEKLSRFSASTKLGRASWRTLQLNKELLVASVLSIVTNLVILGLLVAVLIFFIPNYTDMTVSWSDDLSSNAIYYAAIAVYLFASYAVANYFSGAIAHAALDAFRGNDPTLRTSLQAASRKSGPLLAYSSLQATVGLVLTILSDRLPWAGKIATWIAGAAWDIATVFAIPLIMDNKETNPVKAVRSSAQTFKKVWGESVFIGLGIGLIEIVASVLMVFILIAAIGLSLAFSTWVFAIIGAVLFVIGIIIASTILSALRTIAMTAAYYYASTSQVPAGFDDELIRNSFRPKKAWLQ